MNHLKNIKDEIDCIIYHDPCQDGFSSAWIAYYYFIQKNKEIKLIPKRINDDHIDEELYKDKNVLMVDIVTDDFITIKEKAKNLVILDHHKTNKDKLNGIEYAYFDMNKSGTGLAWEYFYDEQELPKFLACVQDRDIWTWKIPESRAFCDGLYNMLFLESNDDDTYDMVLKKRLNIYTELYENPNKFQYYYDIGVLLDKIKMSKIKSMVRNVELFTVDIPEHTELKAAFFNCTHDFASDLGSYAVNNTEADFAVMWRYSHDEDEYFYSLRSIDSKPDVSKICKLFGGGGHRNAAGCANTLHPKELFKYKIIDE